MRIDDWQGLLLRYRASFVTDRKLEESQLNALIGWLEAVVRSIREFETVSAEEG